MQVSGGKVTSDKMSYVNQMSYAVGQWLYLVPAILSHVNMRGGMVGPSSKI